MAVYNRTLWRDLRDWKRRKDPLCEVCRMRGRITPGSDIHHLETFTGAGDEAERDRLAYDPENLLTVCDRCHRELHHGALRGATTRKEIENRLKTDTK